MKIRRDGNDLLVIVTEGADVVRLKDHYYDGNRRIETVRFADGTTWTLSQDITYTGSDAGEYLQAASSNNTLYGLGGNDTLDALEGNDTLVGGTGNDMGKTPAAMSLVRASAASRTRVRLSVMWCSWGGIRQAPTGPDAPPPPASAHQAHWRWHRLAP